MAKFKLLILLFSVTAHAKLFKDEKCGRFYCPDNCDVTFKDGCPYNCNCRPLVRCPLVSCPAKEPICIVITKLDGCQSCACKLPFLVLEDAALGREPGFIFLSDGSTPTARQNDEFMLQRHRGGSVQSCTMSYMEKTDACLSFLEELYANTTERHRGDVAYSMNPTLRQNKDELGLICTLFQDALQCLGPRVYNACKHFHPVLSEMDAVFGYPCGAKQQYFFQHFDCIQGVHNSSFRLAVCEDYTVRALDFIGRSVLDNKEKVEQKCEAMSWMMGCETPWIRRACSYEAANVFEESLMAATEFVAPDCHPDYSRRVFQAKSSDSELVAKETLICDAEMQAEIDDNFYKLFAELSYMEQFASLAWQPGFIFSRRQLQTRCDSFEKGLRKIKIPTRARCMTRYQVLDKVFWAYRYPCDRSVQRYFFKHYNCLFTLRFENKDMQKCGASASGRLEDGSVEVCETYDILAECIRPTVLERCGAEAWEVEYQYLALWAKRHGKHCHVRRHFPPLS